MENIVAFVIGTIATILSLLYRFPQMYKIYVDKRGDGISLSMLLVQNLSYVCWIAYGWLYNDTILLISTALSTGQNIFIQGMIKYYNRTKDNIKLTQISDNYPQLPDLPV